MIYIFFNPMKLEKLDQKEIPQLEITNFTIYDLDKTGLISLFNGAKGFRYKDRYEVSDINYTDNSKEYISSLTSAFGVYKDFKVNMSGDVVYKRDDGLTFKSDNGQYDQKTGVFTTKSKYVSYRNNDKISGEELMFDNKNGHTTSKNVDATYEIKDSEKL